METSCLVLSYLSSLWRWNFGAFRHAHRLPSKHSGRPESSSLSIFVTYLTWKRWACWRHSMRQQAQLLAEKCLARPSLPVGSTLGAAGAAQCAIACSAGTASDTAWSCRWEDPFHAWPSWHDYAWGSPSNYVAQFCPRHRLACFCFELSPRTVGIHSCL